jgi:hypothetical protein
MGNHHSAVEKEKETVKKEREVPATTTSEGKPAGTTPAARHEKHRSRTITAAPLPPTETKINAEQIHIINNDSSASASGVALNGDGAGPLPKPALSSHASGETTSPATPQDKDKLVEPQRPIKEVVEAVRTMDLGKLPSPTVEEIRKQAAETEPTPIFETIKNVGSETSIIDEDELNEADKSGLTLPLPLDVFGAVDNGRRGAGAVDTRLE